MNLNKTIACPLDCYDACEAIVQEDGTIKGNKEHPVTKGKLCVNFAALLKEKFLKQAYLEEEEVTLDKALEILKEKLKLVQKIQNFAVSKLYLNPKSKSRF